MSVTGFCQVGAAVLYSRFRYGGELTVFLALRNSAGISPYNLRQLDRGAGLYAAHSFSIVLVMLLGIMTKPRFRLARRMALACIPSAPPT